MTYGTILVVDDNPDVRETTRMTLGRQGYEVWLAPDGNSAIQLMKQPVLASEVCAVICDLAMPNGNGMYLIAYLQKHHQAIPIIVCSGADDTEFLEGIIQQGVGDWMRKPVPRDVLVQKVRTAVHLFTLRTRQDSENRPSQASVASPRTDSPSELEAVQDYHDKTTDQ
ncbi:MAG: response regulator [Nitrospira sp. CG24D]|nr:MAG: response regulator [Nitrospira sp. CG24D]